MEPDRRIGTAERANADSTRGGRFRVVLPVDKKTPMGPREVRGGRHLQPERPP